MSHSRWKRNFSDGVGRVNDGLVHFVFVNCEMSGAAPTVPGCISGMVIDQSRDG